MLLEGSCHCGAARFSVESPHPYPFNRCYCSICRKVAGGGGYAINLGGRNETLKVTGKRHIRVYQVDEGGGRKSPLERHFCGKCGSMLFASDSRWPDLVHPFASAIDTELPAPPESTHLLLDSRASWVDPDIRDGDKSFDSYPEESIAEWHERLGLVR